MKDGAGSGDGIIIGKHPAADGGVTVLNFLHELAGHALESTDKRMPATKEE